jgi:hypothetical protein
MAGRRRARIGDIIEIRTSHGLAYAQYTHEHSVPPKFGSLIRVLPGLYTEPPEIFDSLVEQSPVFMVFFPLHAALRQGIVRQVGNVSVPPSAKDFPVFRDGLEDPVTGKVDVWWLWDGRKEWRIGALTEEQRGFPIRQVVNDTMLIAMIEKGASARN